MFRRDEVLVDVSGWCFMWLGSAPSGEVLPRICRSHGLSPFLERLPTSVLLPSSRGLVCFSDRCSNVSVPLANILPGLQRVPSRSLVLRNLLQFLLMTPLWSFQKRLGLLRRHECDLTSFHSNQEHVMELVGGMPMNLAFEYLQHSKS
jgi:hypothetical protein